MPGAFYVGFEKVASLFVRDETNKLATCTDPVKIELLSELLLAVLMNVVNLKLRVHPPSPPKNEVEDFLILSCYSSHTMKQHQPAIAFVLGVIVSFSAGQFLLPSEPTLSHPIGYADNEEDVHVHSDFVVYLSGKEYDLSDDKYMSAKNQILHADVHLHDNNDEVIHRHDYDVTLAAFFKSIGFTLTDECITTDTNETFCTNESQSLLLFINGTPTTTIASYVNQEEDQLLLYYGSPTSSEIENELSNITDDSCLYSGTCPERGVAPPESCGLTCEL